MHPAILAIIARAFWESVVESLIYELIGILLIIEEIIRPFASRKAHAEWIAFEHSIGIVVLFLAIHLIRALYKVYSHLSMIPDFREIRSSIYSPDGKLQSSQVRSERPRFLKTSLVLFGSCGLCILFGTLVLMHRKLVRLESPFSVSVQSVVSSPGDFFYERWGEAGDPGGPVCWVSALVYFNIVNLSSEDAMIADINIELTDADGRWQSLVVTGDPNDGIVYLGHDIHRLVGYKGDFLGNKMADHNFAPGEVMRGWVPVRPPAPGVGRVDWPMRVTIHTVGESEAYSEVIKYQELPFQPAFLVMTGGYTDLSYTKNVVPCD